MTAEYFEHHVLLVYGITLLKSSSISQENIAEANRLLNEYTARFEYLYGMRYLTCNLHLIRHLPSEVEKFGGLHVTSCFPFENLNGILKSYVHGSRYPELQIYSAVSTFLALLEVRDKILRPDSLAKRFCDRVDRSGTLKYKTKHIQDKIYAVGAFCKTEFLPDLILRALQAIEDIHIDLSKCHIFHRLLKNGIYKTNKKLILRLSSITSTAIIILKFYIVLLLFANVNVVKNVMSVKIRVKRTQLSLNVT